LASQAYASESAGVSYQINFASPNLAIFENASPYAINLNGKDNLTILKLQKGFAATGADSRATRSRGLQTAGIPRSSRPSEDVDP
jgi:hypothetical protein